jgi:hypothetical protein
MKKKIVNVKDFEALQGKIRNAKKQIKNELTEDAAELKASLVAMLDELENAEVEIDEAELASRIREAIDAYNRDDKSEVPAAVANALAEKFKALQNSMPQSDKLTPAIKNQVAAAILRAQNREAVQNAVNAVMVKNGITGLTFEETIDFAINDNWGTSDELFNALRKVPFSKFFYTEYEFSDVKVRAHGWDKTSGDEKVIQQLKVNGKTIATQYIYKRQQIAFEDLDSIEEGGDTATFLRWINEELDRQIVNAIVAVMLGDTTNFTDITSIESLLGAGTTDIFRTAVTVTDTTAVTFAEARSIADAVATGKGFKWMVMNQAQLTALSAFVYASGGDTIYRSKEEVAAMLGVDRIYVTDKVATVICFVPDEYWVKEKAALQVSYPKYEFNVMNYQRERNIGAAVHGLKTVAFGAEA